LASDAGAGAEPSGAAEAPQRSGPPAEALQAMVDRYGAALYRAALHLTGRPADAEDLVQETFLRAWRFAHTFDARRDPRGWLFKILMHVHVDYRRRQRRAPETADLLEPEAVDELYLYRHVVGSDELRERGNPEEAFFERLLGGEVQAALRALPDAYRKTLLLFAEGLTYGQIAEALGVPVGTVMSRLHRARTLLEKSLWEYCVQTGRCRPAPAAAAVAGPCASACRDLYRYLDAELDPPARAAVEAHLAVCRACCTRLEFQQRFEAVVRQELGRRTLPRRLRARLARLVSLL
jgi:RNA polymerase sigma-70 factor (ECF subfamily)